MDGASAVEDTWLRARAGEHGYLSGKDAEAISCDALIVPVVTGSPDWAVIGQMITLITDAHGHAAARAAADAAPPARPGGPARAAGSALPAWPQPLEPQQWQDLQHALARLAIHFVSGPGAIASALRRALLDAPLNGKSVILDVGYADTIPDAIRKAVIARDKGCAWPGGCHRRPAHCDVHHVKHKKHGGKTSVTDCVLLCQYHHDICIHRLGWEFELLPDGSTRATSPDRKPSSAATHHHRQPNPAARSRARRQHAQVDRPRGGIRFVTAGRGRVESCGRVHSPSSGSPSRWHARLRS